MFLQEVDVLISRSLLRQFYELLCVKASSSFGQLWGFFGEGRKLRDKLTNVTLSILKCGWTSSVESCGGSHLKLRRSFRRRSTCAPPLLCLLLLLLTRRCAHQRNAVTWRLRKVAHIRGEKPADAGTPLHSPRIRSRVFHRSAPCGHLSARFNRPGFCGSRWPVGSQRRSAWTKPSQPQCEYVEVFLYLLLLLFIFTWIL